MRAPHDSRPAAAHRSLRSSSPADAEDLSGLAEALEQSNGNLSGAARALNIDGSTLYRRLVLLGRAAALASRPATLGWLVETPLPKRLSKSLAMEIALRTLEVVNPHNRAMALNATLQRHGVSPVTPPTAVLTEKRALVAWLLATYGAAKS